jgi:hypothetical protein
MSLRLGSCDPPTWVTDVPTPYQLFLIVKFAGVIAYAAGFAGCFLCDADPGRKRAVHTVASPALVLIWVSGYGACVQADIALTEIWILGSIVLSLFSLMALIHSASRGTRGWRAISLAGAPLLAVIVLMVLRPTWGLLRGS